MAGIHAVPRTAMGQLRGNDVSVLRQERIALVYQGGSAKALPRLRVRRLGRVRADLRLSPAAVDSDERRRPQ